MTEGHSMYDELYDLNEIQLSSTEEEDFTETHEVRRRCLKILVKKLHKLLHGNRLRQVPLADLHYILSLQQYDNSITAVGP